MARKSAQSTVWAVLGIAIISSCFTFVVTNFAAQRGDADIVRKLFTKKLAQQLEEQHQQLQKQIVEDATALEQLLKAFKQVDQFMGNLKHLSKQARGIVPEKTVELLNQHPVGEDCEGVVLDLFTQGRDVMGEAALQLQNASERLEQFMGVAKEVQSAQEIAPVKGCLQSSPESVTKDSELIKHYRSTLVMTQFTPWFHKGSPNRLRWLRLEQIDEEIQRMTKATYKETFKHATFNHDAIMRIQIINGFPYNKAINKIYRGYEGKMKEFFKKMLTHYPLTPNVDLILIAGDGCASVRELWQIPTFGYHFNKACTDRVAIPTYDWTWTSDNFEDGSKQRATAYGAALMQFNARPAKLFWRGSVSGRREQYCKALMQLPFADAKLIDKFMWETTGRAERVVGVDYFNAAKYHFNFQGHGPSFRLKNLLADPGSVMIKVFDQRHGGQMWFELELVPWVHYVPVEFVNEQQFVADVIKIFEWLEHDPKRAEEIALSGAAYARDQLTDKDAYWWAWETLLQYSNLFDADAAKRLQPCAGCAPF